MWKVLMISILLIIFIVPRYSFSSNVILNSKRLDIDSIIHRDGDIVTYTITLPGVNDYTLQIETKYLYDKAYLTPGWFEDHNQAVLAQKIIFKRKGILLNTRSFDVRSLPAIKFGKKVSLLDNVIIEIAVVNGTKGSFYKIEGYGGCNNCTNYTGYFSLNGKLLFKTYSSHLDGFSTGMGDYKNVWKQYGVPAKRENTPNLKALTVFPPQHAGEVTQSYIY
jgi:hypothetical protein